VDEALETVEAGIRSLPEVRSGGGGSALLLTSR
jgi:hypothetical protein